MCTGRQAYGIKFFLESVLKTEDGERLDGTVSAESAFGDVLEAYAEQSHDVFGEGASQEAESGESMFG